MDDAAQNYEYPPPVVIGHFARVLVLIADGQPDLDGDAFHAGEIDLPRGAVPVFAGMRFRADTPPMGQAWLFKEDARLYAEMDFFEPARPLRGRELTPAIAGTVAQDRRMTIFALGLVLSGNADPRIPPLRLDFGA